MPVVKIYTPSEARASILRRVQWEDQEMPASVLDGIERIFGHGRAGGGGRAHPPGCPTRGDAALHEWAQRIDRRPPGPLEVPAAEWRTAYERLPEEQRSALELAAERIAAFHRKQPVSSWVDAGPDGTLGQLIRPLDRAGVYVPGGTAPLPSSLLMAAIPARVAGVGEVVVCTPAGRAGVNDLILAAAHVAKVDRLFALGGTQAIAALAYGTETVPRVDKIVGAGGLFITLAKRQVFGGVGIDGFYGPTETLVIADDSADPAWAAADMLAQAEHDVLASPILLTPSPRPGRGRWPHRLGSQLEGLSRAEIAAASRWPTAAASSSPRTWRRRSSWRTCTRRSTCVCWWPSRGRWSGRSATRAASSSASTRSRCWAITSPGRATSCPPRAAHATPARSASPTSSSASA